MHALPESLMGEFTLLIEPRHTADALGNVGMAVLGTPYVVWMVEAAGMMLPLWEDVLPNVPDEELAAAAARVAAAM